MHSRLAQMILFASTLSCAFASADGLFKAAPYPHTEANAASLEEILNAYQGSVAQMTSMKLGTGKLGMCNYVGIGSVQLNFNGVIAGQTVELKFWLETFDVEQMNTIYTAIHDNYPTRGLPPCVLADKFFAPMYDDTSAPWILLEPITDNKTTLACGGPAIGHLQLTSCIYANPIYPADDATTSAPVN